MPTPSTRDISRCRRYIGDICNYGRECDRIVSSLDLGPKVIRRLSSSCCGLQVIADDDDVLIEISEYDDDDVAVRKIRI